MWVVESLAIWLTDGCRGAQSLLLSDRKLRRTDADGHTLIFSVNNEKDKPPGTSSPQAVKCEQIDQALSSGATERHRGSLRGTFLMPSELLGGVFC